MRSLPVRHEKGKKVHREFARWQDRVDLGAFWHAETSYLSSSGSDGVCGMLLIKPYLMSLLFTYSFFVPCTIDVPFPTSSSILLKPHIPSHSYSSLLTFHELIA